MNLIRRIRRSVWELFGSRRSVERVSPWVDDILDRRQSTAEKVDLETERMWQILSVKLEDHASTVSERMRPRGTRVLKPAMAFAVVVVLLVVAGRLWLGHPAAGTYATSTGEHATITLPDSSVVTLNHTSAMTVSAAGSGAARAVTLNGEAFFRVRKNGTPFVVSTAVGSVSVLGTEFNVLVRGDRLEVAVISGRVSMSARREGRDSSVVLSAGEIAVCSGAGFPETPSPIALAGYPGWMNGKFIFYRTTLASACKEIESQFGVSVRIEDVRLGGETVTGAVGNGSVESALTALVLLTGRSYRTENGAYIVY